VPRLYKIVRERVWQIIGYRGDATLGARLSKEGDGGRWGNPPRGEGRRV
jgi:hypothetical protein